MKMPHGYLYIDLKQATPDILRIRTNVFPDETNYVYIKSKNVAF